MTFPCQAIYDNDIFATVRKWRRLNEVITLQQFCVISTIYIVIGMNLNFFFMADAFSLDEDFSNDVPVSSHGMSPESLIM